MILKVLQICCFCYKSEEKSRKFPFPKKKLNRYIKSFLVWYLLTRFLEDFEKLINLFAHQYRKFYTFISILHKMFLLSSCLIVWWWLQLKGRLLANVLNKEREWVVRSNLILQIFLISLVIKNWNSIQFPESDLIKSTKKCFAILVWRSYK